ncbi:MarR family winged helix-turn-helix transcriptional regulator [Nocardia sp. NPDC057227]|uniref:MarR family winged helix-turn-helix transcriptional regulator n=1 Tax=Nocardia sp. NPDC057227 TaxID=3346056 RepID=UPI0036441A67
MERSHTQDDARPVEIGAAWSRVAAFVSAVETRLGKWVGDRRGIGLTEYRALIVLVRAPDRELRVNDLAARIGLNQSSVTRMLGRLEQKGLTYRDTCPDDGRGVYAVVTDDGAELVGALRAEYETQVREVVEKVGADFPDLDLNGLRAAFDSVRALLA